MFVKYGIGYYDHVTDDLFFSGRVGVLSGSFVRCRIVCGIFIAALGHVNGSTGLFGIAGVRNSAVAFYYTVFFLAVKLCLKPLILALDFLELLLLFILRSYRRYLFLCGSVGIYWENIRVIV